MIDGQLEAGIPSRRISLRWGDDLTSRTGEWLRPPCVRHLPDPLVTPVQYLVLCSICLSPRGLSRGFIFFSILFGLGFEPGTELSAAGSASYLTDR